MKSISILSKILIVPVILSLIISCGNKPAKDSGKKGREIDYNSKLAFITESGSTASVLKIAVADEPLERNEGLMDVTSMPTDAGMLFIFEKEQPLSFWMANTPLSLDIIFANRDSVIVRVHHSTQPFSQDQINSDKPALFVVETNGGYCIDNDIKEGYKIRF